MKVSVRVALILLACGSVARADVQVIAPGTGQQSSVVVTTGANGICETTATFDDAQAVPIGAGEAFQGEIKCGTNMLVDTTAAGDDTQLVAVGASCANPNVVVIDTGANGIADTTALTDDTQTITVGTGLANAACVTTGPNGKRDTVGPAVGDDVLNASPTVGTALANQAVIRCGSDKVAQSTANNVTVSGDDVQVVAVGGACATKNTIVVNSGANGIAETRAEGSDLFVKVVSPIRVTIPTGKATKVNTIRLTVYNVEFGASAPASRTYALVVDDGTCPSGTVSAVDADSRYAAPGLQATATVLKGKSLTATFKTTFNVASITSVASNIPYRCAVSVEADVVDPLLNGAPDDAVDSENNITPIDFEVVDRNDL